jgi:hypothetical protein
MKNESRTRGYAQAHLNLEAENLKRARQVDDSESELSVCAVQRTRNNADSEPRPRLSAPAPCRGSAAASR